jgi:hypothetical protein
MSGKLILKNSIFIIISISLFLIFYKKEKEIKIVNDFVDLRSGDLIFRKELNFISVIFAKIDDSEYSHIGIIFIENDKIFVYHIESDENKNDVKKDEINNFLNSAEKYTIFRYKGNFDEKNLYSILKNIFEENIKFDFSFDLKTTDKLYCTEFVNDIFYKLTNQNIYTYLYDYNSNHIITIKSIMQNKELTKIY